MNGIASILAILVLSSTATQPGIGVTYHQAHDLFLSLQNIIQIYIYININSTIDITLHL